ncbi:hypothetical protein WA158_002899 [Blastocystis sp. Blastoise]
METEYIQCMCNDNVIVSISKIFLDEYSKSSLCLKINQALHESTTENFCILSYDGLILQLLEKLLLEDITLIDKQKCSTLSTLYKEIDNLKCKPVQQYLNLIIDELFKRFYLFLQENKTHISIMRRSKKPFNRRQDLIMNEQYYLFVDILFTDDLLNQLMEYTVLFTKYPFNYVYLKYNFKYSEPYSQVFNLSLPSVFPRLISLCISDPQGNKVEIEYKSWSKKELPDPKPKYDHEFYISSIVFLQVENPAVLTYFMRNPNDEFVDVMDIYTYNDSVIQHFATLYQQQRYEYRTKLILSKDTYMLNKERLEYVLMHINKDIFPGLKIIKFNNLQSYSMTNTLLFDILMKWIDSTCLPLLKCFYFSEFPLGQETSEFIEYINKKHLNLSMMNLYLSDIPIYLPSFSKLIQQNQIITVDTLFLNDISYDRIGYPLLLKIIMNPVFEQLTHLYITCLNPSCTGISHLINSMHISNFREMNVLSFNISDPDSTPPTALRSKIGSRLYSDELYPADFPIPQSFNQLSFNDFPLLQDFIIDCNLFKLSSLASMAKTFDNKVFESIQNLTLLNYPSNSPDELPLLRSIHRNNVPCLETLSLTFTSSCSPSFYRSLFDSLTIPFPLSLETIDFANTYFGSEGLFALLNCILKDLLPGMNKFLLIDSPMSYECLYLLTKMISNKHFIQYETIAINLNSLSVESIIQFLSIISMDTLPNLKALSLSCLSLSVEDRNKLTIYQKHIQELYHYECFFTIFSM